jgi:hypothetical protein
VAEVNLEKLGIRLVRWWIRLVLVGGLVLNVDLGFVFFVAAGVVGLVATLVIASAWDDEFVELRRMRAARGKV